MLTKEQKEKKRIANRKYRLAHKLEVKEYLASYYQAHRTEADKCSAKWRLGHKLEIKERDANYNKNLKYEVFSYYSDPSPPSCKVCGESDIDVLCLDHIANGGSYQRVLSGDSTGVRRYARLRKQGFPEGFQVLCFNCNMKKAIVYRRSSEQK